MQWCLRCSPDWSCVARWLCCFVFKFCSCTPQAKRHTFLSADSPHTQLCHCSCNGRGMVREEMLSNAEDSEQYEVYVESAWDTLFWVNLQSNKIGFLHFSIRLQAEINRNHLSCTSLTVLCLPDDLLPDVGTGHSWGSQLMISFIIITL